MPAYRWVKHDVREPLPRSAVIGGKDIDDHNIYVGRAFHHGDTLPAKVIPYKQVAYICHNGEEHSKSECEVLVQSEFVWESAHNGIIPEDAVVGGQTSEGETLYVGRVWHNNAQTVGKIQPSHGCLYIPFNGEELSFREYEVLVQH